MTSTLCTLVEGDYHLGLAVLANSLHHHGYRGVIWVGIRGPLPPWAAIHAPTPTSPTRWASSKPTTDLELRFVSVETKAHFTNYKPEFLQHIWENLCPEAERLFYFDPDIVIRCRWSFFEEWADYGVALVEDVNSPVPETHPRRAAWKRDLATRSIAVTRETRSYVNGGFIGLRRADQNFLRAWITAMQLVGDAIGGLDKSMFSFGTGGTDKTHSAYPYSKTDQDALNIALMTTPEPVSIMGREGMDFAPGGWTMSHILGPDKPWRRSYLKNCARGISPSQGDRAFWQHAATPIAAFTEQQIASRQRDIKIAAFIGRFFKK